MSLTGRTTEFPLETLLRLLGDTRKTGELVLRSGTREGALGLADGRVVTAVFEDEPPIPALAAVLDLTDADFEFTPWDEAPPANLEGDLDALRAKAAEHKQWYTSIREVIPSDRARFRLSERAADQGAVTFTSERWRVVLAVNGERDVLALASHLSIERNDALNLLAGLVRDGVIEVVAEPAPSTPPPEPAREPEPEPPAASQTAASEPAVAPESAPSVATDWSSMPPVAPEPAAAPEEPVLPPPMWGEAAAEAPVAEEPPVAPSATTTEPAEPRTEPPAAAVEPALPEPLAPSTTAEPPEPAAAAPEWGVPATAEWTTTAQEAPAPPPEPEAAPAAPPTDDRLAALSGIFGPPVEPATPAPAQPADAWAAPASSADTWTAPAPSADAWGAPAPAADAWSAPVAPAADAADPRLGALFAAPVETPAAPDVPGAGETMTPQVQVADAAPFAAEPPVDEWAGGAAAPAAPEKKRGLFGMFKREAAPPEPATRTTLVDRGASTRAGLLAAFSNALLAEYNSGHYGKGRVDERIPSLLMRVDEQADPIDRPLPVVDDRLDVQALDRIALPDEQAAPYLATLVSTIYSDAEKAFGRDKAKRGYKAAQQHVFGGDVSSLAQPDVAGKLPRI